MSLVLLGWPTPVPTLNAAKLQEALAILLGIKLAWSRGFKIRVDSVSLSAIKLFEGSSSNLHLCFNLVRDIYTEHANTCTEHFMEPHL
ncbi:hypothetical protein JHK85_026679 [Glycine max]|nr:hypothetical protein JHK85_026679 [Glycine max]